MIRINKSPRDILDNIYSLAYWMTGNEHASGELVKTTYSNADNCSQETDLLKSFRDSYVKRYGQDSDLYIKESALATDKSLRETIRQKAADVKLSVLLSEISGLKHRQISEIMEKPVETIRLWLLWGRKSLVNETLLKASA